MSPMTAFACSGAWAALMIGSVSIGESQAPAIQPHQQVVERAEEHYRKGELREALQLLSQAIEGADQKGNAAGETDLLVRALYQRARVHAGLDDRPSASRDLERLLTLAPKTRIDPSLVSQTFAELFQSVRARAVTELELSVQPPDAEVRIDDRLVDAAASISMRPGQHVIVATRAGYGSSRREIDLPPGGRVRLDMKLDPSAPGTLGAEPTAALPGVQRWTVFHVHKGTFCGGRLSLEDNRLIFRSVSDDTHSFAAPLTDVREIQGNKMFVGGLKYGGSFHVELRNGGNYNFVSDGFPADQLVTLLQTAVRTAKNKR
jgi:hypothetical protein